MRAQHDPLYALFEQHLFNALVEDESTDAFLARVVSDYLGRLGRECVIPEQLRPAIEEDLREEVLEMLRKKTYGHYNLGEFRKTARSASGAAAAAGPRALRKPPAAPIVAVVKAESTDASPTASEKPAKATRAAASRQRRRRPS